MNEHKMDFDMKPGERLEVCERYVAVREKNDKVRIYNLEGKFLGRVDLSDNIGINRSVLIDLPHSILFKEGEYWKFINYEGESLCYRLIDKVEVIYLEGKYYVVIYNNSLGFQNAIVYTEKGACLIPFEDYEEVKFYESHIILKQKEQFKLYSLGHKQFIGEKYEDVYYMNEFLFLKKENKYYFYSTELARIEFDFDAFFIKIYKKCTLVQIYKDGKSGLLIIGGRGVKYERRANFIFPIKYKKIKIVEDKVYVFDGKNEKYYELNEIIKKVLKKEKYGRGKNQKRVPNTEIFFKGKVSVKYSHVVWMRENYFICSRKIGSNQRRARKKEKTIYECYNLDGNYINVIGTVRDEDDYFCAFMYKETLNMIALGSNDSYPFFSNNVWTVYDKNWKPIFMEKFEQISDSRSDKFIYFTRGYKEDNKGLIAFFSKEGELLFTIRGLKEVMCIEDYYIKIEGFDEKVWFFDFYGNLIFQKKFNYEDTKYNENLVIEKIENGYRVWDLKNRKYTVLEAEEIISKGSYKKFLLDVVKDGKVMLYTYTDDVGFEKLIPGEFVSTEIVYSDKIRVETEEYESIYDFNGNLIATTK